MAQGTVPATREDKVDNKEPGGEWWAEGMAPGGRALTEMAWRLQDNEAFPSHWVVLEFSSVQLNFIYLFIYL